MAECSWAHMREKDETWGVGCAALQAAAKHLQSGTKTAASMTRQQVHAVPITGTSRYPTGSSSSGVLRRLGGLQDLSLDLGCADLQAAAEGVFVTALAADSCALQSRGMSPVALQS